MGVTRRAFLAGLSSAGVGFGLGAFSHRFPLLSPAFGPDWRPGKETFVNSTCLLCPAHCGIRARLVDGVPSRIDGNPLHPVSEGGLCPKGRAGIQLLYHPGRLIGPVERAGEAGSADFRQISWDEALARVVSALKEARDQGRAGSVEWLTGDVDGMMGELIAAFSAACGSDRIASDDYRDGARQVLDLCQGIDVPPAYDLAGADLVLSFGAALSEAWWGLPQAARARDRDRDRMARWIQIDERHSRTAARATRWIPVRPGTYGALALGIAYTMLKEGLYDVEMVAHRVDGWDDWTDASGTLQPGFKKLVLRHGRPGEVSSLTGVPVADVLTLAKSFGTARRPVALWDQVVAWRRGGLADALAIHSLNIIAGSLNRPGGVLVPPPSPVRPLFPDRPAAAAGLAGARAATSWPAEGAEPASILFLYRSNPLASSATPSRVKEAFARAGLVVSFSPFLDESARHAHLVLPDHTYLERWQDAPGPPTVPYPVWNVVQPVTRPLHDTRATGDLLLQVAAAGGGDLAAALPWKSMEDIVRERGKQVAEIERGSAFVPSFRRQELRELESRGWWLPHREPPDRYWDVLREAGGWFDPLYDYHDRSATAQTPSRRVWLFPAAGRQRLRETGLPLAEGFLPAPPEGQGKEAEDRAYPLRLLPYRVLTLSSGGTALMPWLLETLGVLTGDAWHTWVEINPVTARELGVGNGDRVRVESERGSFPAVVRLYAGAQPGVANVPYGLHTQVEGWGQPAIANPLAAIGDAADPATGLPDWYSTRVRLVRA